MTNVAREAAFVPICISHTQVITIVNLLWASFAYLVRFFAFYRGGDVWGEREWNWKLKFWKWPEIRSARFTVIDPKLSPDFLFLSASPIGVTCWLIYDRFSPPTPPLDVTDFMFLSSVIWSRDKNKFDGPVGVEMFFCSFYTPVWQHFRQNRFSRPKPKH